jgi:hypothetical protein
VIVQPGESRSNRAWRRPGAAAAPSRSLISPSRAFDAPDLREGAPDWRPRGENRPAPAWAFSSPPGDVTRPVVNLLVRQEPFTTASPEAEHAGVPARRHAHNPIQIAKEIINQYFIILQPVL